MWASPFSVFFTQFRSSPGPCFLLPQGLSGITKAELCFPSSDCNSKRSMSTNAKLNTAFFVERSLLALSRDAVLNALRSFVRFHIFIGILAGTAMKSLLRCKQIYMPGSTLLHLLHLRPIPIPTALNASPFPLKAVHPSYSHPRSSR